MNFVGNKVITTHLCATLQDLRHEIVHLNKTGKSGACSCAIASHAVVRLVLYAYLTRFV